MKDDKRIRTVMMPSPDGILTFKVKYYKDGWMAQCNEVSGILSGGLPNPTHRFIYEMIADAIICAYSLKPFHEKNNKGRNIFDR